MPAGEGDRVASAATTRWAGTVALRLLSKTGWGGVRWHLDPDADDIPSAALQLRTHVPGETSAGPPLPLPGYTRNRRGGRPPAPRRGVGPLVGSGPDRIRLTRGTGASNRRSGRAAAPSEAGFAESGCQVACSARFRSANLPGPSCRASLAPGPTLQQAGRYHVDQVEARSAAASDRAQVPACTP